MRIEFTKKEGQQHSYEIDAVYITDCYGNEYYIDDSTHTEVDETLTVSKYDHKTNDGLYPVWLSYEQQQSYY